MNEFVDERDDNRYKIVRIGNLLWFAENLRYQGVPHYFPDRNSDNVHRYGCLYTWENAMKACPQGWRLPTGNEFKQLLRANNAYNNTSVLRNSSWGNGSNSSGFGALPAGYYNSGSYKYFEDNGSCFWSSTESKGSCAHYLFLDDYLAFVSYDRKTSGNSVRCVKEV